MKNLFHTTNKKGKKISPAHVFSNTKLNWRGGVICTFGLLFCAQMFFLVHADFSENLQEMGISVQDIQDKKGISRYELAKLLNASECKDCINPAQQMVDTYIASFRNKFVTLPGKDFNDITYLGGIFENKKYYYCVAYVGDNNYMAGYPASTSPICAGKFCGAQNTTKAEFLQVIINVLAKYLYPNVQVDRKQAQQWVSKLKADSYEAKTLNSDDIAIIKAGSDSCKDTMCYLTQAKEVKTYLKYCMFNLNICGMEAIGKIKQGSWPVAELNFLQSQSIITLDPSERQDIGNPVDGKTALEILGKVNGKIQCVFDDDYDCDGIKNAQDSCPNAYNPSQTDTDKDGIGDPCDDDIDGDGKKNPIGIVDEQGRINIRLRMAEMDNCLFIVNEDQKDTNSNHLGDVCDPMSNSNTTDGTTESLGLYVTTDKIAGSAPISVTFDAVSKGNVKNISRDFGDGTDGQGQQVQHEFIQPGIYRIQATARGTSDEVTAQLILKIGGISDVQSALQAKVNKLGNHNVAEFTLGVSVIGKLDEIERIVDSTEKSKKGPDQSLSKILETQGTHTVLAKGYSNQTLMGVVMFSLGIDAPGAMLKANMLNPEINQSVSFQTQTFDIQQADISYISRDFGDGETIQNDSLIMSHVYAQAGKKAVVQTITLINGKQLTNIITLYVQDKNLLRSFAVILTPDKLIASLGEKIQFFSNKVGDSWEIPLSYGMKFDLETTQKFTKETKFPLTTFHSYFQNGRYLPEIDVFLDQCNYLKAQATISINGSDTCLQARIDGTLNKLYTCDMDGDGIPDVCDDDIDGDGIKNLIGILTYESKGCVIDTNIDQNTLQKHFQGICSLDNAPFETNGNQLDLNGDAIGDAGSGLTKTEVLRDKDSDGVPDIQDLCPDINGMGSENGCPEIDACAASIGGEPAPILAPSCNQCPCQYTDFTSNLANGDKIQAILRDKKKTILYNFSLPWIINF